MRAQEQYTYDEDYKGGDWRKDFCRSVNSSLPLYPGTLNKIFKRVKGFNKWHIDYGRIAKQCNPVGFANLYDAVNKVACLPNMLNNGLVELARDVIAKRYNASLYDLTKGHWLKALANKLDKMQMPTS